MSEVLKIRAHHLLCLQGYQGYGYSRDFEVHLSEIVDLFREKPGLKVEVVMENDLVCAQCPNSLGRTCQKDIDANQKIQMMDLSVMKKLNFKPGTIDKVENLFSLVNAKIRSREDLVEICGNCQWRDQCRWFMSRLVRERGIR